MFDVTKVKKILVDRRNFATLLPVLQQKLAACQLMGFDIESQDDARHEGLNELMKIDPITRKKPESTKLIFDTNRTTVTGLSIYCHGDSEGYYFNLAHADVENRLDFNQEVAPLLDQYKGYYIIHNAAFEIVMLSKGLNTKWKLPYGRVLDSMILCVTAYNSDTYSKESLYALKMQEGLKPLIQDIRSAFLTNDTEKQDDLVNKFCAKESDAAHSYNGMVKTISWGYNLKQASLRWLSYKQVTFKEVLGNKAHMGELTGEGVTHYGADDAICCVGIYLQVLDWLMKNNPAAIRTYYEQENPCCWVFAQMNASGIRVDRKAIFKAREQQRALYAKTLRTMRGLLKEAFEERFTDTPSTQLLKYEPWYEKNREKYLAQIKALAYSPEGVTDYDLVNQYIRSPVGKGWSGVEANAVNLSHYMPMRVVLFDLLGLKAQVVAKKVQSDAEARLKLKEKAAEEYDLLTVKILEAYATMADIEQALKLYINNYVLMIDPDTDRMYPVISSLLDTRRTAVSNPNSQQLSKFGASKFVRSFFLPDDDESVILAPDFSAIELVIIGGYSNDKNFVDAYGQRPHKDLHTRTAALMTGVTVEEFKLREDKKQIRTEIGKPSNFGYWYSGSLNSVGQQLGWSQDKIYEMSDTYRQGFPEGEAWRIGTIQQCGRDGFVTLPDHLRRYRFEATHHWAQVMEQKMTQLGLPVEFVRRCIRRIQTRAGNQAVNAKVQGLCATYAKRKLIRLMFDIIPKLGLRARVMTLIHDELVISCHRGDVIPLKAVLYELMIDSEGIFTNVQIDSSMAMGRNFLAWHPTENPHGLVELMEMDKGLPCIPESRWGQSATDEEVRAILNQLFGG